MPVQTPKKRELQNYSNYNQLQVTTMNYNIYNINFH